MNKEELIKRGYKEYTPDKYCDAFYQRNLSKEPTKCINCMYYDIFNRDGSLNYAYEFELIEEHDKFWSRKSVYAIDKSMTLDEIEDILLGD